MHHPRTFGRPRSHAATRRTAILLTLAVLALGAAAAPAQANNSWGDWHWERSSNPVTLTVLNSTTDARTPVGGQNWPALLGPVAADWTASSVLDLAVQPQTAADLAARPACLPQPGAIRVCNVTNPDVTWLGLAIVFPDTTSGGGHLTAATAQVNDSWFGLPLYNAVNAQHVLCQEVGHTFGLDHQSDDGSDLNTCMDYADALDNPSPNSHDYQQLNTIYSHLDGAGSGGGTGGSSKGGKGNKGGKSGGAKGATAAQAALPTPPAFPAGYHGRGDHRPGHTDVFVTEVNGQTVVQSVIWAY